MTTRLDSQVEAISRVLSGYLGGTWVEPIGGASHLELRQSDAHARSEVWLPGQGWQAVDPSSWQWRVAAAA